MRPVTLRTVIFGLVAAAVFAATAFAETKPAQKGPMEKPAEAQQQPAPAMPPAPVPTKTETLNFDTWTVTCQEFVEPKPKKVCFAQMRVTQSPSGQLVLLWTIGYRDDGQLETLLRVPTGVAIRQAIDLKIGAGAVRKLEYATCEPAFCTATSQLDAAQLKELVAAETIQFVVYGSNGQNLKLDLPIKGADKAFAALKRS
ncbi:MAG: invasion associated locus B family protein [Ancalomicrobiaceae bacterium]|nr:invasion associated locus B family protein [Ancalomicrobiaceae bacterium]